MGKRPTTPIIDPLPRKCSGDRILLPLRKAYLVQAKKEGLYRRWTPEQIAALYTDGYVTELLTRATRLSLRDMLRGRTDDEDPITV